MSTNNDAARSRQRDAIRAETNEEIATISSAEEQNEQKSPKLAFLGAIHRLIKHPQPVGYWEADIQHSDTGYDKIIYYDIA